MPDPPELPRIQILPAHVAEQIAAGEVIERPASAVKELVENSLDAGATRIEVEIEHGGKTLIRVTDNGHGIPAEDAPLALVRHATSKLRDAADLFTVSTLGFRGEALASIAAVSELELTTRTADVDDGVCLTVESGEIRSARNVAAPVGTSVAARRLYHNVPVRARFLKSDRAETRHVTDWLKRLALARPDVRIRLVADGEEALLAPGAGDPLDAAVAVLGIKVARDLLPLPEVETPYEVTGFAAKPTRTRGDRAGQFLFVNGRSVRSPIYYRALDRAYEQTMPAGRRPLAIVYLTIPPGELDVNVHPAKTEVRFTDEDAVYRSLVTPLRASLAAASPPRVEEPAPVADPPVRGSDTPFADAVIDTPARRERRPASPYSSSPRPPVPASSRPETPRPESPRPGLPELTLLGQAKDLFILAEGAGKLWVLDQHVIHERVLFDQLMDPEREEVRRPEPLLIPVTVDVDQRAALALDRHRDLLAELGFEVEPFGPGQWTMRAVPTSLLGQNYEQAFRDLADELAESSRGGEVQLQREQVAAAAAGRSCKQAVKAGKRLTEAEMQRLLDDLRRARNPYTCPHGRPVFLTYEQSEVEELFSLASCG